MGLGLALGLGLGLGLGYLVEDHGPKRVAGELVMRQRVRDDEEEAVDRKERRVRRVVKLLDLLPIQQGPELILSDVLLPQVGHERQAEGHDARDQLLAAGVVAQHGRGLGGERAAELDAIAERLARLPPPVVTRVGPKHDDERETASQDSVQVSREVEHRRDGGHQLRERSGRQRESHDELQRHPDKVGDVDRDGRHPKLGLVLVEVLERLIEQLVIEKRGLVRVAP